MARTTCHAFNPQVLGAGADGDAIVPGSYGGVEDCYILWLLDVDAIGVWTVSSSHDLHTSHLHILTMVYYNVEHLAV